MKLHPLHRIGSRELSALITELKSKEIMSNQSFELIDGDSLEMQVGTFRKAFQTINDNCLVISILGPQSSGKSTLLNFLFGCDFSVSEGRCTRGLYGTYFRLSGEQGSGNSSSILVIDTEGIFAITNNKDRNEK
jgi:pantothenate kinase-related protein Tda10